MSDYLLLAASRVTEIMQEEGKIINHKNISTVLKQTAREFSEKDDDE